MPPTNWQPATIVHISPETPTAKTFRLRLNHPSTHLPGQHYIVKLTDPVRLQRLPLLLGCLRPGRIDRH